MKLIIVIAAIVYVATCAPPPPTPAPTKAPPPPPTPAPTKPPTAPPTAPPTPKPIDKDELLKIAAQLDKLATDEISKFKAIDRVSLVANIQILQQNVRDLVNKLKTTTGALPLEVIKSQLFWLERQLGVEIEATEAAYALVVKLLNNAAQLKVRIDEGIKRMGADTPVGKALAEEGQSLEKTVTNLKNATDARTIQLLEFDLALIEERVKAELGP
ncbi:probable global transcription activator SNF2L2 [Oppia nitens]|uniref:probable global transcription activator SNF2L2 n=1 Tax=Oppia nitens TaxID=1686743 RepID=UPI0023DBC48E|nr:probable global transcription activator SNF2L2 [Oppia nitens]